MILLKITTPLPISQQPPLSRYRRNREAIKMSLVNYFFVENKKCPMLSVDVSS